MPNPRRRPIWVGSVGSGPRQRRGRYSIYCGPADECMGIRLRLIRPTRNATIEGSFSKSPDGGTSTRKEVIQMNPLQMICDMLCRAMGSCCPSM